jgi:hypothetical protein
MRHASIFARASSIDVNWCTVKHSRVNRRVLESKPLQERFDRFGNGHADQGGKSNAEDPHARGRARSIVPVAMTCRL